MLQEWRRRRAAQRVKPGDGRPLKRFRWWQMFFGRALFHLPLTGKDGRQVVYTVDVRHSGDKEDFAVRAQLYRDGWHHAVSRTPAFFPVEGGTIEVATTSFGLRRSHYVTADGAERQLTPDPKSAEGRRARLEREHPSVSRVIGVASVIMLIVGVGLNLLQIIEPISRIPPSPRTWASSRHRFTCRSGLNITLGLGAALASTERALRLRSHWLLDAGGN